jgi:hypothetical protein
VSLRCGEVHAIRDVDRLPQARALHQTFPARVGQRDIEVRRVSREQVRQERIARRCIPRVDLRQAGQRLQQLLRGLDLGRLVAGDDLNDAHRVGIDARDRGSPLGACV